MSEIIDRVYLAAEAKGLIIKDLERKAELANGTLASAKKRRGSISAESLSKIFYHFERLNARWLLTGEGEMWLGGVSVGAGAQIAIGTGGDVQQHQVQDPCAELRLRVAHLEELLAEKERLIGVLMSK